MKQRKNLKSIFIILVIVEFFNGISGLGGGIGLISDPTAASLGMELGWLEKTPFSNYLIPGMVLFIVNGIGNTVAAVLSLRKHPLMAEIAVIFGVAMMIWIISQVVWIGYKSFLQPLYFSTGLIQGILGGLHWRLRKRTSHE